MTTTADGATREQPAHVPAAVRRTARQSRTAPPDPPAADRPVARVAVDLPLAHLDRPFDYLVGESQSSAAVPGARVRVRFAGQELAGFILERHDATEFAGRLVRLRRVVSPEPVLAPEVAALARLVADRWAGTLADVLRLAVPPRHAAAEKAAAGKTAPRPAGPGEVPAPSGRAAEPTCGGVVQAAPARSGWERYPGGRGLLDALASRQSPRLVWTALPGEDWPAALAATVQATLAGGRGALVVVPDARDVERVDAALTAALGAGRHVALTAELGPAERYRRWLAVRRGEVRAVVGTRAATYAPVADLGLAVIWDDGDDLHAEPHAPYAHSRDVLTLRAYEAGAAAVLGGFSRTAEAAQLVASGWARSVSAGRDAVRRAAPRITVAADDAELARDPAAASARLPSLAWRTARDALARGPVLVQVPRSGYVPVLACAACRAPARCAVCAGSLSLASGRGGPTCVWCGRDDAAWTCPHCGDRRLRAVAVGSRRTAEELGRALPGVPVLTSGRGGVLATVGDEPALVVSTPGAEPVAAGGYAAALLLDGAAMLARADLRAAEETLRRWLAAAALVRPASAGGTVVVLADAALVPVQALVRWDPAGHAVRELAERDALGLPPAARVATLTGPRDAVTELLALAPLPGGAQVLGPVPAHPLPDRVQAANGARVSPGSVHAGTPVEAAAVERALVRVRRSDGPALAAALQTGQRLRSARKALAHVRVQVDPLDLG